MAIADPDLLAERAARLGLELSLAPFDPAQAQAPTPSRPGQLKVWPVALAQAATTGRLDPANAGYVLETLRRACDGCLDHTFDALVTGPVHKGIINEAGIPFTGHTEYLAEKTHTPRVVMMLAGGNLRVALATTHLPLKDVPAAITAE